ncbi:MAG: sensor histidine kinase [Bacteroidota bacterium]
MDDSGTVGIPGLLIAGIVGMFLLALAIIVFFVVYQRRLFHQQEEMNRREAEYQKELLHASIQSQEEERKRIASDLHDSVGALLSATKMYLKQIGAGGTKHMTDVKTESLNLVDETIQNVRQISHNLLPPTLERFGFVAAVEDMAEKINKAGSVKYYIDCPDPKRFDLNKEVGLYRIVQELTNNTIKHAQANKIMVELIFNENKLQLIYQDDGVGFEMENKYDASSRKKGLGLRSLESRANFIGADFKMTSQKGEGVKAEINLPLENLLEEKK